MRTIQSNRRRGPGDANCRAVRVDAQQGITNGGSYSVGGCDTQSGADVYGDVCKLPRNRKTEN